MPTRRRALGAPRAVTSRTHAPWIAVLLALACGDATSAGDAASSASGTSAVDSTGSHASDDAEDTMTNDDQTVDGSASAGSSSEGADDGPKLDVGPDGALPPGCGEGSEWIYLLTSARALVRFRPDTLEFADIGPIACAPAGVPYSLAVARDATAWALFVDPSGTDTGTALLRVNTTDASCEDSGYAPGEIGFQYFGMGFSSDEPGGAAETLFVSGGRWAEGIGHGTTLATLDLRSLALAEIGAPPGIYAPEMTGTGDAELWGLFVQPASGSRSGSRREHTPSPWPSTAAEEPQKQAS